MAPQETMVQMQQRLEQEWEHMNESQDNHHAHHGSYHRFVDFPDPFQKFRVSITLEHPYSPLYHI